jgi:glycosyltransferase involved in cell wall biosynthesis
MSEAHIAAEPPNSPIKKSFRANPSLESVIQSPSAYPNFAIPYRGSMSISVVIPAYNAAQFIRETLDSVLNQTLPADEVLVIDDGSTDETASIAESYGSAVRVFRRPNSKQSVSRNFGVQEAKSEWIAFNDADDIWESNKLERQMAELSRHPEADLCYTGRILLVQNGRTAKLGPVIHVPPAEGIRKSLFRKTTFLPSSVIIRKSAFLAVGGFDPHFELGQDWELWLRLLRAGTKFAACTEPLVQYRIHPSSVSRNAMRSLQAGKEIYRRHVLPQLPRHTKWILHQRSQSEQEAIASFTMREMGDPRHLSMMALSIVRYPFNDPHRYKVLAYMLYTRFREFVGRPAASRHAS